MKLAEVIKQLELKVYAGGKDLTRTVKGGYAGDLLSDVMANGPKDHLWITVQVHPNIIAVAVLKELAGIVLVNGREPAPETAERAEEKGVPLIGTRLGAYEFAGRLYGLGVKRE
jgi:hypothetical protein